MNLSCYIIDDEPHAIGLLAGYIQRTPGLTLAGSSTDPLAALATLRTGSAPDIVFTDIDMPELNGIELAGLINSFTAVILTTSYREYGPEAYENHAADYLLKPFTYERFLRSIQFLRLPVPARANEPEFAFVKTGIKGQMERIVISDILYVSAALNYIEIHLRDRKLLAYLTLSELMDYLPSNRFSRIHRTTAIAHSHIRLLEYGQVRLTDDTVLSIGQTYRQTFRQKMEQLALNTLR